MNGKSQNDVSLNRTAGQKRVAIITLTWNRLDYTKRMFESMKKGLKGIKYDHYIIDQGSNDGTVDYLKKLSKTRKGLSLTFNKTNVGLSHGYNQALDKIGNNYDYILHMDNDCEVLSENCLFEIIKIAIATQDSCLLSPFVEGVGSKMPRIGQAEVEGHMLGLVYHLGGIFTFVPSIIFEHFRYNKDVPLYGGGQDAMLSQFSLHNGFALAYVEDLKIMHMDGTGGQTKKYPEYVKEREQLVNVKYKGT